MSDPSSAVLVAQDFIPLRCPYCALEVDFLSSLAGTAQGCPNCGNSIVLPRHAGETASKVPIPLEGDSILLRRLVVEDCRALLELWKDVDDIGVCEWLRSQATERLTDEGQKIYLGIQEKRTAEILGYFMLEFMDISHLLAAFQFQLKKGCINTALFQEACRVLFALCFGALNVHRLVIQFRADLKEYSESLELLGMRREGHFRKDLWEDGEWQDTVMYAYLLDEYKQRVGSPK